MRTSDGSLTLYSERYAQAYASMRGARTEALHVFLDGAGVARRLDETGRAAVLEIGFGTGLNFLVTAERALANDARLRYVALERELVTRDTFRSLEFPPVGGAPGLLEALEGWLPPGPPAGADDRPERRSFSFGSVRLELLLGDARDAPWDELAGSFDAVYQDAFSPEVNPELWTYAFLERLHRSLRPGGALGTYCVKGDVRRALAALGFEVAKRPGPPGGKRETLVATRPPDP